MNKLCEHGQPKGQCQPCNAVLEERVNEVVEAFREGDFTFELAVQKIREIEGSP